MGEYILSWIESALSYGQLGQDVSIRRCYTNVWSYEGRKRLKRVLIHSAKIREDFLNYKYYHL